MFFYSNFVIDHLDTGTESTVRLHDDVLKGATVKNDCDDLFELMTSTAMPVAKVMCCVY